MIYENQLPKNFYSVKFDDGWENLQLLNDCGEQIIYILQVVCALLSLKHIVTPDYLEKYVNYLKGENEKPDPDM